MNTPITPVPAPPEPPKPVVPPEPISGKKIALYLVIGLFAIVGITLAAWEEGRVNLGAGLGFKGYKRRQADRAATNSNGHKPNYVEAFRLYQLDAEKGDGEALRKIGEMYRDGRGVPQSDAKARDSWNKAAASGDVATLIWLSEKYRVGDGRAMPVNHPESLRLLRRAGSQGDALAQGKLARQLLAYVAEYRMKLEFDEVLSARQKEELLALPKVRELLKANADGSLEKQTKGKLQGMAAEAGNEVGETLREKFQWEAYFWLSLAAASNDEAELRALRDGVASKLKDKQVERVQGLVAKWSRADAPGIADSPFVMDEGPVVEVPDAPKQSLSALLEEISDKARKKKEEPVAAPVPPPGHTETVSVAPARPLPATGARPITNAAEANAKPAYSQVAWTANDESIVETKAYVSAMYEAQLDMAVRRNILLSFGNGVTFDRAAKNYGMAGFEVYVCYKKLENLRKTAKMVHPAVLDYSDALAKLLAVRSELLRKVQLKASEIARGQALDGEYPPLRDADASFVKSEYPKVDALEAFMVKRLGSDCSFAPPERAAAYAVAVRNHTIDVERAVSATTDADLYKLMVGINLNGWVLGPGELVSSRRGNVTIENDRVKVPMSLTVRHAGTFETQSIQVVGEFSKNYLGKTVLVTLIY